MSRIKKNQIILLATVLFLSGMGFFAYPSYANWQTAQKQERILDSYKETISAIDAEKCAGMLQDAGDYNQELEENERRWKMNQAMKTMYESILQVDDTGVLGYVDIPAIHVQLPIYHGTSNEVLKVAIGHLEGSSFPTSDPGTHCVITGHRSRASAKLFRDLDELETGDTFSITVLNETMTYEVDRIKTVDPHDMTGLEIEEGSNYCTLVTCTPYGSDKQRLLVRGKLVNEKI